MVKFSKTNKSKYSQIIIVIIACLILLAIMSSITLAWLMDESITSNGDPNVTLIGDLDLDVTTNFKFNNLALAPDTIYTADQDGVDIATYIRTSDKHDIDGAYVRVKYETTRKNVGESDYIDNLDLLKLYFSSNYTTSTTYNNASKNKWFYNSADNYYYYLGGVYHANVMFNRGYRTTNMMTNVVANANVTITITVDSIQRQYGAAEAIWDTSPQIFKDMVMDESATFGLSFAPVVDGTVLDVTLEPGLTISEALAKAGVSTTYNDDNTCGWYADEECTIPLDMNSIYSSSVKMYTRTATLDKIKITTNSSGQKVVSSASTSISGMVVIPKSVEVIGQNAFHLCNKVTGIIIPNGVKTIEYFALHNVIISSIHIPKTVTSIDANIGSCRYLTKITVDAENPRYTDGDGNCIIDRQTKILQIGCMNTVIPTDSALVTTLGLNSFAWNTHITSLYIPANITTLQTGFNKIENYHKLVITVDAGNSIYKSIDKCVINKQTKELVHYTNGGTIPADGSVTKLAQHSIECIDNLYINKYITYIDPIAIRPKNITCDTQNSVFKVEGNCLIEKSSLKIVRAGINASIPSDIKSIGKYAFLDIKNSTIQTLIIPSTCTKIESYVFYYWNYGGSTSNIVIYLPKSVTTIEENAFRRVSATIYTDATSTSKPSGWNSNMCSGGGGADINWKYGYTLEQFKSENGL